jgi:flagellar motility protein MotE (MotC chaperone)
MDKLYEDENAARTETLNVLNQLEAFNQDNPNTMINQFFFQGKSTELIKIFSKAKPQDKARAAEILAKLDITNAGKYKDELK